MTRGYPRTHHAVAATHTTAATPIVYDLLKRGATWPTWINLDSMRLEREGHGGGESVGAIRLFRFRRAGIKFVTHEQVVELVSDRQFSYTLVSGLPLLDYRADVVLSPTPEGGTYIHWSGSWSTKIGIFGLLTRPVMKHLYVQFGRGLASKAEERAEEGNSAWRRTTLGHCAHRNQSGTWHAIARLLSDIRATQRMNWSRPRIRCRLLARRRTGRPWRCEFLE